MRFFFVMCWRNKIFLSEDRRKKGKLVPVVCILFRIEEKIKFISQKKYLLAIKSELEISKSLLSNDCTDAWLTASILSLASVNIIFYEENDLGVWRFVRRRKLKRKNVIATGITWIDWVLSKDRLLAFEKNFPWTDFHWIRVLFNYCSFSRI